MKKIALALIVLANLGNGSDDEFFVKKNENLNKSFVRSMGKNRPYKGDRNFTIDEDEFEKALMAENNKTKLSLEKKYKYIDINLSGVKISDKDRKKSNLGTKDK